MVQSTDEIPNCIICKTSIQEDDKLAICTNCDRQFHFTHLQSWLMTKNNCPNCKHIFSFDFMQRIRPRKKIMTKNGQKNTTYQSDRIQDRPVKEESNPKNLDYMSMIALFVLVIFFFAILGNP